MQWMIRKASNRIEGPLEKETLKDRILGGELSPNDEICSANGFWFQIHEDKLLFEALGIHPPHSNAEDTQTNTQAMENSETTLELQKEKTSLIERAVIWKALVVLLFALTAGLLWGVLILLNR